jgi:hypothetical protein
VVKRKSLISSKIMNNQYMIYNEKIKVYYDFQKYITFFKKYKIVVEN